MTNIPGYAINTQNVESEYNKGTSTTNYEITTRKSDEVVTPGGVRRLTASVLVDGEVDEAGLGELREVVSSAIGFSEARGDTLVVKAMRFSTAFADALLEELRQERLTRIITGSVIALVMLLLAAVAVVWWLRRRRARMAVVTEQEDDKHVPTIQKILTSPNLFVFFKKVMV